MTRLLSISAVRFTAASARDEASGLIGFISLVVDDTLVLDGLTLRRTRSGRHALSYPERVDRRGDTHPLIRPRDDAARRQIEELVLKALGIWEEQP